MHSFLALLTLLVSCGFLLYVFRPRGVVESVLVFFCLSTGTVVISGCLLSPTGHLSDVRYWSALGLLAASASGVAAILSRHAARSVGFRWLSPASFATVAVVVTEVRKLTARGVKEVNLVAQDLTAYGRDLAERPRLSDLLAALGRVDRLEWLRTLYLYPSAVTVRLLKIMANVPQVVPYLEVPVQHVSERVLAAMRRGYGARSVHGVMERIRKHMPEAFVRTTLMVGHPAETRKAFEELKRFVREVEPDHMGVFAYSREEGTASAKMRPSVSPQEAEARRGELMEMQREISARKLRAMKGKTLTVLVDGPSEEFEHLFVGRHAGQAPGVFPPGNSATAGSKSRSCISAPPNVSTRVMTKSCTARFGRASPGSTPHSPTAGDHPIAPLPTS